MGGQCNCRSNGHYNYKGNCKNEMWGFFASLRRTI